MSSRNFDETPNPSRDLIVKENLLAIGELIRAQDNLSTSDPIFTVQRKRRDYGYDTQWSDNVAWLFDGEEVDADESKRLEAIYQETGDEPEDCTRAGYVDRWEFVTACFTRKGCEDYLRRNGHNLGESRIYVESAFRNEEWIAVREFLKEPKEERGV